MLPSLVLFLRQDGIVTLLLNMSTNKNQKWPDHGRVASLLNLLSGIRAYTEAFITQNALFVFELLCRFSSLATYVHLAQNCPRDP